MPLLMTLGSCSGWKNTVPETNDNPWEINGARLNGQPATILDTEFFSLDTAAKPEPVFYSSQQYGLDKAGRVTRVKILYKSGLFDEQTYSYDKNGQQLKTIQYADTSMKTRLGTKELRCEVTGTGKLKYISLKNDTLEYYETVSIENNGTRTVKEKYQQRRKIMIRISEKLGNGVTKEQTEYPLTGNKITSMLYYSRFNSPDSVISVHEGAAVLYSRAHYFKRDKSGKAVKEEEFSNGKPESVTLTTYIYDKYQNWIEKRSLTTYADNNKTSKLLVVRKIRY